MPEGTSTIRAIVRALEGEDALVEVEQGGCGRCHEEGGCGGQHLTQMFCSGPKTYRVINHVGAGIGDRVTIAVAAGSVRRTANLAYGVPLTATIIGAALGTSLNGDLGAILGATLALGLAVFYVRFRSQDRSGNFAERPYIVSRS
ncbi:MAG: SoxR reducing system RseC family protein [Azonexus sp.]|nr:SoxR reducing system RseC family protein [Azonexus sp.]